MIKANILLVAALATVSSFAARQWSPKESSGVAPKANIETGDGALNEYFSKIDVFGVRGDLGEVERLHAHWKFSGDRLSVARKLFSMNGKVRAAKYSDPAVCRHLFEMNAMLGLLPEKEEFAPYMSASPVPLPVDEKYRTLVGIVPDPESVCYAGFRAVLIAPKPDRAVGFSRTVLDTQSGRFLSHWRFLDDSLLVWDVEIPSDVEVARIKLPWDAQARRIGVGRHSFTNVVQEAQSGIFERMLVDVSSLPPEKHFLGKLFLARVCERVPPVGDGAGGFTVSFSLDRSLKGEEATVSVKGQKASVKAARFRGLLYGAGILLRSFEYGEKGFKAKNGIFSFKPAKEVRMAYFANHFLNFYMQAPIDVLRRYVEDLAFDGINAVQLYHSMPAADAAREGDSAKAPFLEKSLALIDRLEELDLELGSEGGFNQLPADSPPRFRAVPNTDMHRGNLGFNACPSDPEAMEAIRKFWGASLKSLEGREIAYLRYWSFDEGGCECEKCFPYGEQTILSVMDSLRADHASRFPSAKTMLSTWMFHDSDFAYLWKRIESRNDIDYILVDHTGEYPQWVLDHPLPSGCKTKILTFPEISMWGRMPWGGYGAIAYPKRLHRLFKVSEKVSSGCHYYSEGIYEDINKWFVTSLYVNPSAKAADILSEYAAYHFPGVLGGDFVRLVDLMEDNHVIKDMTVSRADEMVALAQKMDKAILPSMRDSWRWRHVYLRALIDREVIREGVRDPKSASKWFDELVDIYHVRRQLELWRSGYVPCGWTTPQFREFDGGKK